jgi:aminoglycoside 3-N-acetyltransferase
MVVTASDIQDACRGLGLSGSALCLHSSLRSFGRVEGGATAVIEGLLAEGCTVMVPAFSWAFAVPPPVDMRPPRNGCDYDREAETPQYGVTYTPESTEVDSHMGAIPAALVTMAGSVRGWHPFNSFAAVGPRAHDVIDEQRPLRVYRPLQVLADLDGWVVLLGTGLTSMTMLHLAEKRAGRTLFRRWANNRRGWPMMVETGSCSAGFDRFETTLASLERQTRVGESLWRIFPARATLRAAAQAIRMNPEITRCADPECERCPDAIAGGPILQTSIAPGLRP